MPKVAVVDIGSNSIKVLLASRAPDGALSAQMMRTLETRISAGISREEPRLSEAGMADGVAAVASLLSDVEPYGPDRTVLVATSAVRDAANGLEFRNRVKAATGMDIRILTGEEEANLIGRGLLCDPMLSHLQDFQVFDLGGGSLECLGFRSRRIERAASLPLGCVRLTEKFVPDPSRPLLPETLAAISAHVHGIMARALPGLEDTSDAVGTGGTLVNVRRVLSARTDIAPDEANSRITVVQLREMLARIGSLPLAERRKVPGLPPERADVFPAALATFVAVAEFGGFEAFQLSLYNLRWGVAAEALEIL